MSCMGCGGKINWNPDICCLKNPSLSVIDGSVLTDNCYRRQGTAPLLHAPKPKEISSGREQFQDYRRLAEALPRPADPLKQVDFLLGSQAGAV